MQFRIKDYQLKSILQNLSVLNLKNNIKENPTYTFLLKLIILGGYSKLFEFRLEDRRDLLDIKVGTLIKPLKSSGCIYLNSYRYPEGDYLYLSTLYSFQERLSV